MKTFTGALTALASPFKDGAFDVESYTSFIEWQIAEGIDGIVPIGTTGEAVTMTAEEQFLAVKTAVQAAKSRVPVIAGAGTNATSTTVEAMSRAREAGADGALVVTPYYNKPTQDGLVAHYRAIAKAHPGFPIVAYNVPGRTGLDMQADTLAKLADVQEIVAIKEATASLVRVADLVERCGDRFTILSGDDFTVVPLISMGGKGVISVSTNIVPRLMSDMVKAARAGDFAKAAAIQVKLNPLHRALFLESNPIPVKAALHLMGKMGPEIRMPLQQMSEALLPKLKDAMKALGLS